MQINEDKKSKHVHADLIRKGKTADRPAFACRSNEAISTVHKVILFYMYMYIQNVGRRCFVCYLLTSVQCPRSQPPKKVVRPCSVSKNIPRRREQPSMSVLQILFFILVIIGTQWVWDKGMANCSATYSATLYLACPSALEARGSIRLWRCTGSTLSSFCCISLLRVHSHCIKTHVVHLCCRTRTSHTPCRYLWRRDFF